MEILTFRKMVRAAWQNRNKDYYSLSLITSGIPGLQVPKKGNKRTTKDACNSGKNDKLFLKEYCHELHKGSVFQQQRPKGSMARGV